MNIVSGVLGGKFENALIHGMDTLNHPDRNQTSHPYYLGLNRDPGKLFFDRAATFLTVFEHMVVPLADWDPGDVPGSVLSGSALGLQAMTSGAEAEFNEWDRAVTSLVDEILDAEVLPQGLYDYICSFDTRRVSLNSDGSELDERLAGIRTSVARHYLCRLILQTRVAAGSHILVLDDVDVELLAIIAQFVARRREPLSFEMPDVPARTILGQEFCGGLLNFSPSDAASVAAIRADPVVARYAAEVRECLAEVSTEQGERALLRAMSKAYENSDRLKTALTAFEVRGWIAKPITYIPVIGNIASGINDVIDVAEKAVDFVQKRSEWHLLAARAQQINIEDYINRKANML